MAHAWVDKKGCKLAWGYARWVDKKGMKGYKLAWACTWMCTWICIGSFLFLAACGTDTPTNQLARQPRVRLLYQAKDVKTRVSQEGKLHVYLKAPVHKEYTNGNMHFPKGIYLLKYGKQPSPQLRITADSGSYTKSSESYTAAGNVDVVNLKTGESIHSELLNWDTRGKRLYTDSAVRIEAEDGIHEGVGLEAKDDFSAYEIYSPTGTLELAGTDSLDTNKRTPDTRP